jgi:hypothetical protein
MDRAKKYQQHFRKIVVSKTVESILVTQLILLRSCKKQSTHFLLVIKMLNMSSTIPQQAIRNCENIFSPGLDF